MVMVNVASQPCGPDAMTATRFNPESSWIKPAAQCSSLGSNGVMEATAMRAMSVRTPFITIDAIIGAVLWGTIEFFALQWSRISEQLRVFGMVRGN